MLVYARRSRRNAKLQKELDHAEISSRRAKQESEKVSLEPLSSFYLAPDRIGSYRVVSNRWS